MKKCTQLIICILVFSLFALGSTETDSGSYQNANTSVNSQRSSVDTSVSNKSEDNTVDDNNDKEQDLFDSDEKSGNGDDAPSEPSLNELVSVVVVDKKNYPEDWNAGRYSDYVQLLVDVTNNSDKPIQGVQGTIRIDDLFGQKIISSTLNFTGQIIQPGETVRYDRFGLDVNEFIDSHVKLYNEKYEDLNFSYKVTDIVYSNEDEESNTSSTSESAEVIVTVTDKKNIQEDWNAGRYSPYVQFIFEVENKTDKTIRGIQGVLTVNDLFGKQIKKVSCDFTGTNILPEGKVTFSDKYLEINEFVDADVKLYNEKYGDLQFSYKVTDIVYAE